MKIKYNLRFFRKSFSVTTLLLTASAAITAHAAGLLKVNDPSMSELQIRNHQVQVTINNGFAQTEVTQTFYNPNSSPSEALYVLPLPQHASLSEMEIWVGEKHLMGEVVEKQKAQQVYESESQAGNNAGLAEKSGIQHFEFWVSAIPAQSEATVKTVYYQPVEIDTGMGKYSYPLEEGGTDEIANSFWTQNDAVQQHFSIDVVVKSAVPVTATRVPLFTGMTDVDAYGNPTYHFESQGGNLNKDFVFYYQLQSDLPGRVEVIPYRSDKNKPGTFMMVITPGVDLQPIQRGADYVFVLDISGSMDGKIHTLVSGVQKAIASFCPEDRFRIVLFNNSARELTKDWVPATPTQVQHAIEELNNIANNGGTNLYEGLRLGLDNVDADRITSMILVTDGVTNTGELSPAKFAGLLKTKDIRVFGFLMGNSSNWELMDQICSVSGGFYKAVSNSDDIIGQILLAKGKILFECMHNVEVKVHGVKTFDLSQCQYRKIFRGQQLVVFGKFEGEGEAEFEMNCRISGEDKTYKTHFAFPELDMENPELERLWALSKIEEIKSAEELGIRDSSESKEAVVDLALNYQIVTDETSMIVLDDAGFSRNGIERRNAARIDREHQAQSNRQQSAPKNYQVDQSKPAFENQAPHYSSGGGGGAIHPFSLLGLIGLPLLKRFRKQK